MKLQLKKFMKSSKPREAKQTKLLFGRLLAGFFISMVLLTIISRAADSIIIPKVKVNTAKRGSLNFGIEGNGKLEAVMEEVISLPSDLKVKKAVAAGTEVNPGDVLVTFMMEELQKKQAKEQAELDKLNLQLRQEQLNGQPAAKTPEQESARMDLELAQMGLQRGKDQLRAQQEVYNQRVEQLGRELDVQLTAESQKFEAAKDTDYSEAKTQYDTAVAILKSEYQNQITAGQSEIDVLSEALVSLSDTVIQAQNNYNLAAANDQNTQENDNKTQQKSKLMQDSLQIDIGLKQKEVGELNDLAAANGEIKAKIKGTITAIGLSGGSVTSEQDAVKIGTGGIQFTAELDKKEQSELKIGDELEVQFPGKSKKLLVKISSIQLAGSDNSGQGDTKSSQTAGDGAASAGDSMNQADRIKITAPIEDGEYPPGTLAAFAVKKASEREYDALLPIDAVRQDREGLYCLAAEKRGTIMGEEYIAVRIKLNKLDQDTQQMAVEGALSKGNQIIVESNKNIVEGDRVRIEK